jgi:hypothetical protein
MQVIVFLVGVLLIGDAIERSDAPALVISIVITAGFGWLCLKLGGFV